MKIVKCQSNSCAGQLQGVPRGWGSPISIRSAY